MKRTPLVRRTPLRAVSAKRRVTSRQRKVLVERILADRRYCQAQMWGCEVRATAVHEPLTRARGGSILEESNTLAVCWRCHARLCDAPKLATELGLLRNSWEAS